MQRRESALLASVSLRTTPLSACIGDCFSPSSAGVPAPRPF
jgi:hypothetical protein